MTELERDELLSALQEALDEHEKRKTIQKTTMESTFNEYAELMRQFDYESMEAEVDDNGEIHRYVQYHSCAPKIRKALVTLLRCAYQVDKIAHIPAEEKYKVGFFLQDTLSGMKYLGGG